MQQVINPYDGSIIEEYPTFSEVDVRKTIGEAVESKTIMCSLTARERGDILDRTSDLLAAHVDSITQLIVEESGKPIRYARGEVMRATETFTFAADEARRLHGETIPMDAARGGVGKVGYFVREPVGVIGAITPFNFPTNLVAHKVAPAIAAGNAIIVKPAPATPLTALRLRDLMIEAGLPDGAFQIVLGDGDVGRWLTTDPRVDMLSFTGSPGVGKMISQAAGLRRLTLELGGNAATIIHKDVSITEALIDRLVVGSFAYSGQVCISVQRIYIHEACYAEVVSRLVERTATLKNGDPMDEATEIGPLINEDASERIGAWLTEAVEQGARVLVGGRYDGRFFEPTIVENVSEDMKIMCLEVFGPLVNVVPYKSLDEVIDQINTSEFGLQAGIYTGDLNTTLKAIQRLDVGGVMINDVPTFRVDHMPYGGNRDSGVGREGPRFAVEEMTNVKMVVINSAYQS